MIKVIRDRGRLTYENSESIMVIESFPMLCEETQIWIEEQEIIGIVKTNVIGTSCINLSRESVIKLHKILGDIIEKTSAL